MVLELFYKNQEGGADSAPPSGARVNLGPKKLPPIASTRREQSIDLFREALRRLVSKRQGVAFPPPARTCYGKCPARARVKLYLIYVFICTKLLITH